MTLIKNNSFNNTKVFLILNGVENEEEAYAYLPESVGEFPYGKALAEKMESVGLRNVQFFPLTFGIATLYVGTKRTETSDH